MIVLNLTGALIKNVKRKIRASNLTGAQVKVSKRTGVVKVAVAVVVVKVRVVQSCFLNQTRRKQRRNVRKIYL